ncbi:MAG: DUF4290 domain-containing protein [Chitinophagales bacterium]|nr:DUF4290 domain-containing protein [Chitinophagales bacterium]
MEYNTQRPKLLISEYGRIIQNMARYAATIEDQNERNATARVIIELMSQANPAFKNIEEYKHKLWDHLIMISDFKLVVDSPYPFPERRNIEVKSNEPLPYPKHKIKFRHYGKNLETLVEKTKDVDPEKRNGLAYVVANYMKLVYANWNKETVSDDLIRQDLKSMSKGLLELDQNYNFEVPVPGPNSQFSFKPQKKNFAKGGFAKKNRPFNGSNNRFKRRNNPPAR